MADVTIPREAADAGGRAIYERSIAAYSGSMPSWDDIPDAVKLNFREAAVAVLNASARLVVAAELEGPFADALKDRADQRAEVDGDDHDESGCGEEGCDGSDCHTAAAVTTWLRARTMAKARAIELRAQP